MTSKVVVFINRLIQKEDYNMSLYFKNEDYKERALKDAKKEYVNKDSRTLSVNTFINERML